MTHFCRVTIARDESHARPKPTERVVAQHDACGWAIIEVDDTTDEVDEFGWAGLEQFIPRPGLEYGQHGLAVMTARVEAESSDDFRDFSAYHRDVVWRCEVSCGGPQAEETMFTSNTTLRIEIFDSQMV